MTNVVDQLPRRLEAIGGDGYWQVRDIIGSNPGRIFARESGKWTCEVRRAKVRFETMDWKNYIRADSAVPEGLLLTFYVTENTFSATLHAQSLCVESGHATLNFRVGADPVKPLSVYVSYERQCIDIYEDSAVTLSRYLVRGKRLAVEVKDRKCHGHVTGVFDITGFECANLDALRRFVFL